MTFATELSRSPNSSHEGDSPHSFKEESIFDFSARSRRGSGSSETQRRLSRPPQVPANAIWTTFEGLKNGRPIFRDEEGRIIDVSPRYYKGGKLKENGYNDLPKRKQVKRACKSCKKACKRCSDFRPCERCVMSGSTCEEVEGGRNSHIISRMGPPYPSSMINQTVTETADTHFLYDTYPPVISHPPVHRYEVHPQVQNEVTLAPMSACELVSRSKAPTNGSNALVLPSIKTMLNSLPTSRCDTPMIQRGEERPIKIMKFPHDIRGL